MSPVTKDDDGNIGFFFAKAPGQVADNGAPSGAVAVRGARSGNSKFDPVTGKFAGGSGNAEKPVSPKQAVQQNPTQISRTGIPQGITPEEWERRLDTVKDAARGLGPSFSNDDVQTFLEGRVKDVAAIDVQTFVTDVRAQQVDDLVDAFAQRLGGSGDVTVKTGNSYITRLFAQMQDTTVVNILNRLIARGFEPDDVQKNVTKSLPKKRQETIAGLLPNSPSESDDKEKATNLDDEGGKDAGYFGLTATPPEPTITLSEVSNMMADAIAKIPAPIVNIPTPPRVRKVAHRDESGKIDWVEEVPIDG